MGISDYTWMNELNITIAGKRLAQKARTECWTPEIYLTELYVLEFDYRQDGRLQRLLKDSKLPIVKRLSLYDFEEISGVNAQQIRHKLDERSWVKRGHNILIFGASGLGKTHIASALGYGLLEYSTVVKFFSSTALVEYLQRAKHEFDLEAALKQLDKYEVLILDDIDYVKKSDSGSQVLFELIAYRYERGSLIITSNHAFSGWDGIFGDNIMTVAAIDRLIHYVEIYQIKGESYRKKQSIKTHKNRLMKLTRDTT